MLEQTPLAIKCYLHNIKPHSLRHSRMSSINKETSNDSIKDLNNYVWFDGIWRHVYDWIGKRSLILKVTKIGLFYIELKLKFYILDFEQEGT